MPGQPTPSELCSNAARELAALAAVFPTIAKPRDENERYWIRYAEKTLRRAAGDLAEAASEIAEPDDEEEGGS